jgi:ArsR family metal-binding transcriptional regulator
LCELLNKIWSQRKKISPCAQVRRRPGFLDVWQLLPHTGCQRCGQPGCLAFAVRLSMGLIRLDECRTLFEQPYGGLLVQLRAIISDSPPPEETSIDRNRDNRGAIGNLHA